ncbi:FAD/NAD(P)-binding protein [Streptomyces longisporoflavus]|uniref:FAD/NAD(P)-binding protein n=1 Tax=Streptomyces longisporoflavus TaxID=28044 RepID=UPI001E4AE513|nr:FAD/NAD(P)-binding protein [Streptomyces longisporoflavus]
MNGRHGLEVGIVGMGPRGLSTLERLCANAATEPDGGPVTVHVVDPAPAGAGRVWRTDQSAHLLMNTVAEQVTVFTDAGVSCAGPVVPGPDLYAWASSLPAGSACHGEEILARARALGPNSYPSRALYGCYLHWAFHHVVRTAPARLRVCVHEDTAVALSAGGDGRDVLRLSDGTRLPLDAVVLAQGHVPGSPARGHGPGSREAIGPSAGGPVAAGARHVPPGNPADADMSAVAPGDPVALRGLGLAFFDYLALFTEGRGGRFESRPDGTLAYRPSGREPCLYAGSRRGLPYQARGENQKGPGERHRPLLLTPRAVRTLRERAAGQAVRFRADVWPLISREVELVYYEALLRRRGTPRETAAAFLRVYRTAPVEGPAASRLLDAHGIKDSERWDWDALTSPYPASALSGRAEFTAWLASHLEHDAALAREGNVDEPVKAALDALRDLRNEIRQVVDHAGITGSSYRDELTGWYTPLNASLSIGPPGRRIAQMAALIRAGVLTPLGPQMQVTATATGWEVSSAVVPGDPIAVTTLVEARIQETDVRTTSDPLLRHLIDSGEAITYRIPDPDGDHHETGALAVTRRPARILDAHRRPYRGRFALGVPTEGAHWATAAGIRPGVDSVTLGDTDAIARAVLALDTARPAEAHALAGAR